ncbi:hypothetical protein [Micromonospora sp. CPCC 206061]|uniref:hypothetical protein n=1 Tax=Micromonospora sp. CPCC 206061 TaxID=3122410 RepID=UPI002FEFBF48
MRLSAFALTLGAVFGGTYAAGALAGPVATETADAEPTMEHEETDSSAAQASASGPGGLAVSADGYTLRPVASQSGEFAFRILDASNAAVTGFQTSHDKQLHLIVVRRDLTGFQHLHPTMTPEGTWRTPLTLAQAGQWRVFADFLPTGRERQVILGVDVPVGGLYQPAPLPAPATTVTVEDYTIAVHGDLRAGHTSRLTLTVSKAGVAVTDLQPYLGAYGHLVALRDGDLGFLHIHPHESTSAGPQVSFDVEVPTAGAYRLFLDFQHGGVVRTAAFTATAA